MNPTSDRHREAAREINLELPTSVLDQGVIVALGVSEAAAQYEEHLAEILAKHFPSPSSGTGLVEALNRMLVHFAGESSDEDCIECGEKIGKGAGCDTCYVISEAIVALANARFSGEALRNAEAGRKPTRTFNFDDADHPFREWWEKHGQFMLSGGGRRESIWAARGWIAREQLADGVEVTGDSLHEHVADSKPSEETAPAKCLKCGSPYPGKRWCIYALHIKDRGTGAHWSPIAPGNQFCVECDNSEFHGENAPSAIGEEGNG